ncbi:MAG: translocation/assembly module TamB domain-containing protein [Flavobacteriales bacterium]|nr:translocation/assembly module TamB domain-containing protein [Flavobacteriales bacterium]
MAAFGILRTWSIPVLRKTLKILRNVLIVLILLFGAIYFSLFIPAVQTWVSQRVASYLSEELGAKVTIGRVEIDLWAKLSITDLYVEDQKQDTLAFIPKLTVNSYSYDKVSGKIFADDIELDSPFFNLVRHQGDTFLNHKFILDYIGESSDSSQTLVYIDHLKLVNGRFNYNNENRAFREVYGIDWNHLGATGLNLDVSKFSIVGDSIHAMINTLTGREKTGFGIQNLRTELFLVGGETRLMDADIATDHSAIQGDMVFFFKSLDDFDDFEHIVKMNHQFDRAEIDMNELAYFSSDLHGFQKKVKLTGQVKGLVSNLKGRNIEIEYDENTRFKGNFDMEGLPEIDETFISLDIKSLTSNKTELDRIQLPPYDSLHYLQTPENFAYLGSIEYKGNFTGFINDFVSYGTIHTAIGKVRTDLSLKEDPSIRDYRYTGGLALEQFNLGKFYSSETLGAMSCDLNIEGTGLELKKVDASVKGDITQLTLNHYDYTGIKLDGVFKHHAFSGIVSIDDPNVTMDFNGSLDFTKKDPVLAFDARIQNLNLKAVHILENYNYSSVSGDVSVRSEGFEFDKFRGEVLVEDLTYCAGDNEYNLNLLELTSTRDGMPKMTLNSDIAAAEIEGDFEISEIGNSLLDIVSKFIPSFDPPVRSHKSQQFNMDVRIFDLSQITEVYAPDLKIADNSLIHIQMDEPQSYFEVLLVSDSIQYGSNRANALTLDVRRPDESFYITAASDQINTSTGISFADLALDARTEKDTMYTSFAWGNTASQHSGDVNGKLTIRDYDKYDFTFNTSSVKVLDQNWQFKELGKISMDSSLFTIQNFMVYSGNQQISASGVISHTPTDLLSMDIKNFDLSNVNPFTGSDTKFYGVVNGTANIRDAYQDMIFSNNIRLDNFKLNEYHIGNLDLISAWDQARHQLRIDGKLEKDLQADNQISKYTPLSFAGYYRPRDKVSPLDISATIQDLDLSFINAFLEPGILDISGYTSGTMIITGKPEAPQMRADALLKDASIFVNYLNTRYYIEEEIGVYPDMFTFDHIRIHDQEGKKGFLTGQMLHNNFGDWNFDLSIDAEEPMLVLNTNEELNSLYYGKAYSTGNVNIYGYEDKLEFDIALKSEKGTTLAMPMGNTDEQTFDSFIQFVNANDTIEDAPLNLSGIKLNMSMEITPDAEFQIIFDQSVGDVMRGTGKGHINMEINNLSTFNMYGTVELLSGNYLFTLKNLINKDFDIKPGGTINWFGDPFAAELDIDAIYKVSASLYDLIPDPNYQNGQRVPINLVMHLNGRMFSPGIEFSIALPNVDQVTRSRVDAIISTEQERNRQAFALLVLRRFVSPPNVAAVHNNTNALAANGTELLSSQISNWLSQISDDFNLGFNYSPGDDISNEEIALALSTQLFNERLSLSSNLGVSRNTSQTNTSQNTTNLIGDIRIEYKITSDGKIRLVVYNESNDFRMAYTQQSPYTQGVGVIYREDFDTFDEFLQGFKNLLKRDKDS